jgi:hypothetical protein
MPQCHLLARLTIFESAVYIHWVLGRCCIFEQRTARTQEIQGCCIVEHLFVEALVRRKMKEMPNSRAAASQAGVPQTKRASYGLSSNFSERFSSTVHEDTIIAVVLVYATFPMDVRKDLLPKRSILKLWGGRSALEISRWRAPWRGAVQDRRSCRTGFYVRDLSTFVS